MIRHAAAVLTLLLATAAIARAEDDPDPLVQVKIRALLDTVSGDGANVGVARSIAALGPDAIPYLFAAIEQGISDFRGSGRRETVYQALRLLPGSALNLRIRALATGEAPLSRRITGIRTLGETGARGTVATVMAIAGEMQDSDLTKAPIGGCVRTALVRLLALHPEDYSHLQGSWMRLRPLLRRIALDAASERADFRALHFFGTLLQLGRDDAAALLDRMAAIRVVTSTRPGTATIAAVTGHLEADAPSTRRLAAIVAGQMHVADCCERLAEMLEDEDPLVRIAAWRSLKQMSGLGLGRDRARWDAWLEGQRDWWETESRREIGMLGSRNAEIVVRTIASLGTRRLYRDTVVRGLLPRLRDPNPRIRLETCKAIRKLGSPEATETLVDVLPDDDEVVAQAKLTALRSVTGLDLPADPTVWREALRTGQ